jgi:type I restriction enzyme S subunit
MNSSWLLQLPNGWSYAPLSDLVSQVVDNRGKSAPTAESGIPLIATNCISNEGLYPTYKNLRYVSEETYRTWFRGHPKPGDIIFVNKGTPGLVCQVPDPVDFCFAQDMVALRPNEEKIDGEYLLAALRSPYLTEQVEAFSVGTTIPHLKKSDFPNLIVPVPPRGVQKFIGRLYCDMSRKIEVNRRINRTLEAMAQALYKHWFVDFGPFQDGEFVESELGLIPHGWEVTTLSHFVAIDINSIKPADYPDEVFNHYSIPAFDEGLQPAKDCGGDVKSSKYLITSNRILVSKLNPRLYRIWTVYCRDDHRSFSSTEFINYLCKHPDTWAFLNCHLRSKDFVSQFRSHVAGTTGSRQRVAPKDTLTFQCVQPDKDTLCNFDSAISRYFELIQQNIDENRILAVTRNYLLPRLLSGEVPVEAAEDMVEASAPNEVAA